MANAESIAAAGRSLERFLTQQFAEQPPLVKTTTAHVVRTEDLKEIGTNGSNWSRPLLTLYLYRIDFNTATRASWSARGHVDGRSHLPVDLHFLATAWADNAIDELKVLGRAMQSLETTPILSGPLLHASGGFAPQEAVQICMDELSTEAVMRTFDSLPVDYRLSVPYILRVLRIDGRTAHPTPPVTTAIAGATPTVDGNGGGS